MKKFIVVKSHEDKYDKVCYVMGLDVKKSLVVLKRPERGT